MARQADALDPDLTIGGQSGRAAHGDRVTRAQEDAGGPSAAEGNLAKSSHGRDLATAPGGKATVISGLLPAWRASQGCPRIGGLAGRPQPWLGGNTTTAVVMI